VLDPVSEMMVESGSDQHATTSTRTIPPAGIAPSESAWRECYTIGPLFFSILLNVVLGTPVRDTSIQPPHHGNGRNWEKY
jgi:hypothetical protein